MTEIISLINAAKYYKGLTNQDKAFDYLASLMTTEELTLFAKLYRDNPVEINRYIKPERKVVIQSQRDYTGNNDGDKTLDAYQTCNLHSVSMVLNAYGKAVTPRQVEAFIKSKNGSRYSHASLAQALGNWGLRSDFSTATPVSKIISHLESGELAIWSNKLTAGGHIVVLCSYLKDYKCFVIADPYGEPSMVNGRWVYKDVRKPYRLSLETFNRVGMNGANASGQWSHLISLM